MLGILRKKIKGLGNNYQPGYLRLLKQPIDSNLVLLEGGQGTNLNGNMFALLKTLQTNPAYGDKKVVYTVTKANRQAAKERMEAYGFSGVTLVVRNSRAYCRALARAGYLFTDNSFPPYFNKRAGQTVVNTWHGTPLKTLGKASRSGFTSLANVQKNFLNSDYALFPNDFTRQVFMEDYDLAPLFGGVSVMANYPRNCVFYDTQAGETMKAALGLADKRVFCYMPTWRDGVAVDRQLEQTKEILEQFDRLLDDDTVLLVNLHFLLASAIDCQGFTHIRYFPARYETYEVLNACDGLITDYSSVFFDYAVTRKKVILFGYDKEEYLAARGLYMALESLPFPVVSTVEQAVAEMELPPVVLPEFLEAFCAGGSLDGCRDLLDLVFTGESQTLRLIQETPAEDLRLVYAGGISPHTVAGLTELMEKTPKQPTVVVYRGGLTDAKKKQLERLGEPVWVYGLLNTLQFSPLEWLGAKLGKKDVPAFTREANRLFAGIRPAVVVKGAGTSRFMGGILRGLCRNGDIPMEQGEWMNKTAAFTPILPWYFPLRGKLRCFTLFSYQTGQPVELKNTFLQVGDNVVPAKITGFSYRGGKRHLGLCCFSLSKEELNRMPANSPVGLCYNTANGETVSCHGRYCWLPVNLCLGLRSVMWKDKATQTVAIFRQMPGNRLNVYVRSANVSDGIWYRLKQTAAFICSLFWHTKKANSLVLLFEKNGAKYEESASVLFEELLASGYKNAYFIVDQQYPYLDRVPEGCRANLLYKHSFRHYLYFFRAKTLIGTEAVAHAIDLKTFNALALLKIVSRKLNYVFLQHGVMYMVSLNSEARDVFAPKRMKNGYKYRVVTSSDAEANHFMTLGGYPKESLYVCGLPKFDRNRHTPTADRIVIMPTWRPWEINQARQDFTATGYYQMLMGMYNSVPDRWKDKVQILPHPLIVNELGKLPQAVADKMVTSGRYDEILQDTALLITDYSSIAYDGFYRGANVIFDWSEKDQCMAQYGPSTRLMLNEDNVYGDVVYTSQELREAIENNYLQPQCERYRERYQAIVAFHDSQNTKRLMECLKKDGLIQ